MKKLFKNQWVVMSVSISVALVLLILGVLIFNIHSTDRLYIIHYKAISGIDLFGSWKDMYFLGVAAIGLLIFNLLVVKVLWSKIRDLSYLILFINPVLEIIILVATIFLVSINR